MTKTVTATVAKARISALLDEVAAGAEIEITKRGKVVARMVPAAGPKGLRGLLAGMAMSASADEDELFTTGVTWEAS